MTEPRIQYVTTGDGVRIAYAVEGEGRPLVALPGYPWTHLTAELTVPTFRLFHELLAARTKYVRFDMRGTGLSERSPTAIGLDDRVLDLEAVVDRLELAQFDAWAWGPSGQLLVAYAAKHPERLRRLVLWDAMPQGGVGSIAEFPRLEAILELMKKDWELFSETSASVMFGWSSGEEARTFAKYLREAASQEMAIRVSEQMFSESTKTLVSAVTMPTLVMVFRDALGGGVERAAELTSLLPNASMGVVEGTWISTPELARKAAETILEFLEASDQPRADAAQSSGTVTILFTDLASSTALTQRLGDAKAQELVRAHNQIVREALTQHGGTEIKHTGDGIMASFPTASGALECAVAIQRGVALRQAQGGDLDALAVHIGVNAGEPVAEESDLFGTSVQLARRICDHASTGQVLVSNVVRELSAGKGFLFADAGEVVPKGFDEAVRLYEVRWQE